MKRTWITLWITLFFLLSACTGKSVSSNTPTSDIAVTQASVEARPTETSLPPTQAPDVSTPTEPVSTSTPTEEPPTPTPEPTEIPATPTPEYPPGRTFLIIPEESQASYTVEEEFFSGAVTNLGKKLGFFQAIGITNEIDGFITLDPNDLSEIVGGEFTVNIESLTSDDDRRDERIQTQFLQSRVYPEAIFIPTMIQGFPENYEEGQEVTFQLVGELTIRTVTNPATFDVIATLENGRLTGSATVTILMTDFGFSPPEILGFMKAENEALITLQFVADELK